MSKISEEGNWHFQKVIIFGFQDHHSNHDWTHGERRSQDHCFKINPQLANIVVAPDCKDDGEDGDDGDNGEDGDVNG